MTLYDTILFVCAVITAIGTPISIWIGYLNLRGNRIQQEQTGEYREQTEIMRAQAAGAPVPARVHSLPSAAAQLSWFRRQGGLPYLMLAGIFAVASASLSMLISMLPYNRCTERLLWRGKQQRGIYRGRCGAAIRDFGNAELEYKCLAGEARQRTILTRF